MRGRLAIGIGLATALLSCRDGKLPSGSLPSKDLVALFDEAEVRADGLDLPFLLPLRGAGWASLEGNARAPLLWSRRAAAVLHLPFYSTVDKELTLTARGHASLGARTDVGVTLNGKPLGSIAVTRDDQEFRLVVPRGVQSPGDNLLGFAIPGGEKQRGLALSALRTRPVGSSDTVAPPAPHEGGLRLPAGSSVGYYLRQEPSGQLVGEALGGTAEARLVVSVEVDAGRRGVIADVAVSAGQSQPIRASLSAEAGALFRMELANPGAGSLALRSLRVEAPAAKRERPSAALPKRPNIVFFLVDTLRADFLGAYGHRAPTSPRFDAFARQALVFDDAMAQAPWTRSAVASIFTGLHVGSHGVDKIETGLGKRFETLSERLRTAGYRTGGFFSSYVIRKGLGFEQGFDSWNDDQELYWHPATDIVERALRFVDSGKGPFFLYVHTLEPHSPYNPPQQSLAPFLFEYKGNRDSLALLQKARWGHIPPAGLQFLRASYEGEILENDAAFGALLDGLRARGFEDDTLVIFTSDHGEEFLEHGQTEHGKTLYREVLRIPLAVRFPGRLHAAEVERATVQQVDLMPTLLALSGVPRPAGVEGRDLSGRWLGSARGSEAPEPFFSEVRFEIADKFGIRLAGLKLVRNFDNPSTRRGHGALELYDTERDPGEILDVASARPIAARYLANQIEGLRRLQTRLRERQPSERVELSPRDKEQLRALGYIQ